MDDAFELCGVTHLIRPWGEPAGDLEELRRGIAAAPPEVLFRHAAQYPLRDPGAEELPPDDFSAWIGGVVQDDETAERLSFVVQGGAASPDARRAAALAVLDAIPERRRRERDAPPESRFRFLAAVSIRRVYANLVRLASREGELLFFTIDGNPNLHAHYAFPQMSRMLVSPLSSDGALVLALIPQGVGLADNRTKSQSIEIEQPAYNLALSADGRHLALGSADSISLYRLGRPQLSAQLEPLGKLSKGRFTRLRITLQNNGERMARNIEVSLEGPLDCTPAGLPEELKAGESATSEKQSLQPLADGSLPVTVHLKYSDDFGLRHQHTDRLVLESAGSPSRSRNNTAATQKFGAKATVTSNRLDGICVNTMVFTSPIRLASQAAPVTAL